MKKIVLILMLLSSFVFAAPPASDVVGGTNVEYTQFPYNPPSKGRVGPAFDENGLNRSPLIILDKDGKPLTPDSKVLNRGKDVGCGLILIDGSPYVVRCR